MNLAQLMTYGTDMSNFVGITSSLFMIMLTEVKKMKVEIDSILAGVGCAGSSKI